MSWLALKMMLSGAFEAVLKAFSTALEWLLDDWRNAPLTFIGLGFAFLVFVKVPSIEDERDANLAGWIAERSDHAATAENYRQAARQAQAEAEANVVRVAAEQAAITEEVIDDYESRLAAVRARAERLRFTFARTDPGGADAPDLSGSGDAAGPAAPAPGDPRFPAARTCPDGFVCLTLYEALIATSQAIQLDVLIDWTLAQSQVRFNPIEVPSDE